MKCQVRHRRCVSGENVSIEFVITHGVGLMTETRTGKKGKRSGNITTGT